MSTIHDRIRRESEGHSTMSFPTQMNAEAVISSPAPAVSQNGIAERPSESEISKSNADELNKYLNSAAQALGLVDDVVLKQYLTRLTDLDVLPVAKDDIGKDVILFKINKMVYEKDEFATDKFISVVSAMTYTDCSVFLIVDGYEDKTDFYLGIRNNNLDKTTRSVANTFEASLKGQFPGIITDDTSIVKRGERSSDQDVLLHKLKNASTISSCVGIPSLKDADGNYTNASYIQGIEKLALAMQGKRYTAIVLASNLTPDAISEIRNGYEKLYTQLSAVSTQQLAYSTNESLANAVSRTRGYSDGITQNHNETVSSSDTISTSHTDSKSVSKKDNWAKWCSAIGAALATVGGAALMATGAGIPAGAALVVTGIGGGLAGAAAGADTKTDGIADTNGASHTNGKQTSDGMGTSHTETFTETNGQTATIGSGKNFTLTLHNKHVEELQKRIDQQLERIALAESTGLWSTSTYFFSYDNNVANAETGAAIFKSIMQGETSGVEMSAVNTWYSSENGGNSNQLTLLSDSIQSFRHPVFEYVKNGVEKSVPVENSSLISSKELAMMLGLPRKSVPGLPVVEHVTLAKEVVKHIPDEMSSPSLDLGRVFDLGREQKNEVRLNRKSLTQHVFVTGSTGSGKSETVYKLIDEARHARVKFMVIEPAKGEYKNVFGDIAVYGTNSWHTPLLRINPFRFPKGIHVLEHIDRLTEIFNVCWPMYAAMPAVLKKAILKAYEDCGWNLRTSQNKYSQEHDIFPSFSDLLEQLENVINSSAYSAETKSDYIGSLVTRVESLTNGMNGEIFTANELSDKELFDEDVIVDLSRIGSQETKSLIMGLLVMRLSEYRMVSAKEANSSLRHLTILEEAHNILKRTSKEQSMEGSNVAGKSVEMITNAIAEMRTYGEGFVIVDQSPTSVDEAAIKNTNTKIIMRLPDADDREISGKASGLKDNQIDEIAKLPTGVAVVYQNDWVAPVLCKVHRFEGERHLFKYEKPIETEDVNTDGLTEIVSFLMKGRVKDVIDINVSSLVRLIRKMTLSTTMRINLLKSIKEYSNTGHIELWKDSNMPQLSKIISQLLGAKAEVEIMAGNVDGFDELDEKLGDFVKSKIEAEGSLLLNIKQCLMEEYAEGNEIRRRIANTWAKNVIKSC